MLSACSRAAYQQIFTSVPLAAEKDDHLLGRVNLRADMTGEKLAALLHPGSGVLDGMSRKARLKQAGQKLLGDTVYSKLWNILNRASERSSDDQHA